jgi:hypothetical protein
MIFDLFIVICASELLTSRSSNKIGMLPRNDDDLFCWIGVQGMLYSTAYDKSCEVLAPMIRSCNDIIGGFIFLSFASMHLLREL